MEKKWLVTIITVIILAVAGIAAAIVLSDNNTDQGDQTVTVIDIAGREVEIKSSDRIVSQSAAPTALLCGLGATSKLVGVSSDNGVYTEDPYLIGLTEDDFPKAINDGISSGKIKALGGMYNMSAETIAGPAPDLAILDSYGSNDDIKAALDSLGINYIVVAVDTVDRMYKSIEILGKATGKESNAERMISEIKTTINKVTDWCESIVKNELKGEKYNVALMMTSTYAIGPDYIGGEIISALHVNNVFEDLGRYAQVTKESIAKVNPDILMYQSLGMGDNITDHAAYIASLAEDPVLGKISAVENGLVYSTKDAAKNVVSTIKQSIVCAYAIFAMFIYNEYLDFELPHVLDNDNYVEYLKKFWNQVNS